MIGIQHANKLTNANGGMVLWNGLWRMASDWGLGLEARGKTSSEPINDKFLMADCYMAKNYHLFKVVENRMQQCCAVVHSSQKYCSALLHLIAG